MVAGKCSVQNELSWYLGMKKIQMVDFMDILGIRFSANGKTTNHLNNRITSTRRAMYGLCSTGMAYPGLATDVKVHLWNTIGVPCLMYGLDAVHLPKSSILSLESTQGSIIKRCLGIGGRSHHSKLLRSLYIDTINNRIKRDTLSFLHRVFNVSSPYRKLCSFFLARYVVEGKTTPCTLIDRVVNYGESPMDVILHKPCAPHCKSDDDGVIDSLRFLLLHENYVKPWSVEYNLTRLLTRVF